MVPAHSGFVNWQQGFGIVDYDPDNSEIGVAIYPVKVNNGVSIYSSEILYGEDLSKQIAADTAWRSLDIFNIKRFLNIIYL